MPLTEFAEIFKLQSAICAFIMSRGNWHFPTRKSVTSVFDCNLPSTSTRSFMYRYPQSCQIKFKIKNFLRRTVEFSNKHFLKLSSEFTWVISTERKQRINRWWRKGWEMFSIPPSTHQPSRTLAQTGKVKISMKGKIVGKFLFFSFSCKTGKF